jgi:hypothetical protein
MNRIKEIFGDFCRYGMNRIKEIFGDFCRYGMNRIIWIKRI